MGLPDGFVVGNDIAVSLAVLVDLISGRYGEVRDHLQSANRLRTPTWDVWDAELIASDMVPVDSEVLAQALARLREVDPEERVLDHVVLDHRLPCDHSDPGRLTGDVRS